MLRVREKAVVVAGCWLLALVVVAVVVFVDVAVVAAMYRNYRHFGQGLVCSFKPFNDSICEQC